VSDPDEQTSAPERAHVPLEAKLRPPATRAAAVHRPRLVERLALGRRAPVALIDAPAGYGKTMLAADFATGDGRPLGWYSIGVEDNDPRIFLRYVAAALERCGAPLDAIEKATRARSGG